MWSPLFECVVGEDGRASYRVGHELVDEFLEFIAARARPNTVKAYAHDLKVFFTVVAKEPSEVTSRDVMGFITEQRRGRVGVENVVRISDGSAGLSAATIKRRLAAVSARYGYLVVSGDAGVTVNPVPRGLPTRQRRRNGPKVVPLVRGVRRLPRILDPVEVDRLVGALRTDRAPHPQPHHRLPATPQKVKNLPNRRFRRFRCLETSHGVGGGVVVQDIGT